MMNRPQASSPPPLVIFLIYGLVSLGLTYPLPLQLFSHIPLGDEPVGTVPLFNLWTLQWNIDQLMQGYPNYWDAPIFTPTQGTFAFSETQPLSALLAAPLWLGFQSPAFGYNAVVILFLTLNGWFTYWLLKSWDMSSLPALLAGVLMQALPFVAQEMGVLQLITIFGFLWTFFFLSRFLAQRRQGQSNKRNIVGLALGTPVTFFTCAYYGLFSLFFIPLFFLFQLRKRHFELTTLKHLALAGLLTLIISGPFLYAQRERIERYGITRSTTIIENNSARFSYYSNYLDSNILYSQILGFESNKGQRLFPGFGLILLAALGLLGRSQKRVKIYLVLAIGLALLLSMGLRFRLGEIQPYQWIRDYVPGFLQLRSPFRFAVLVQLHLALLAGFGLGNLHRWISKSNHVQTSEVSRCDFARNGTTNVMATSSKKLPLNLRGLSRAFISIVIASLVVFESLALPLPLQAVPDLPKAQTAWQSWLQQQNSTPQIVMLPFAQSNKVADFEQTTRWMLESRYFQSKIVNGYSGFFPPDHAYIREQMLTFPTVDSLDLLNELHIDYVVVHHNLADSPSAEAMMKQLFLVFHDELANVSIYALRPPG